MERSSITLLKIAGFKVQGARCKVWEKGARCKVQGARSKNTGFKVQGAWKKVLGVTVQGPKVIVTKLPFGFSS
jgi:hypothetical protein